jgi:hypothetical protein
MHVNGRWRLYCEHQVVLRSFLWALSARHTPTSPEKVCVGGAHCQVLPVAT